ncbi:dihydrolipoamide dehydrogenase [Desulfonispora thiosulfatigenes DSM 11270]|uniref:Dihydrolipoyl dehydrogenase n=1 Tax=Desulfonispora thiosulfatigenes DSM 11270 TaxID=656914 RepID=A0A1W1ULG8_DESTI|nr:dihydrolipoyl dehydrogenase [Desulfonispora thiosulfatigenes]SMB81900.1 dihydrolipoamide dehydrogenase [Desulfonispora thiosulfatigenes DSM 11270]
MDYDILIIGGGPGGYTAAIKAAQLGAKVGVIERENLGGTCLNWGCIPTKALYKNAEVMRTFSSADTFGITFSEFKLDFSKVQERKNGIISKLVSGIESLLKANKIEMIKGTASFLDKNTVQVSSEGGQANIYQAPKIIIATGSVATRPPIEGVDLPGVLTSKDLLETTEIPESLVIIGGGIIGMEFASIFNALGTKVKVIEFLPDILANLDKDIIKRLVPLLKKQGIEIYTSTKVQEIKEQDAELCVLVEGKKGKHELKSQKVLIAVGRKANLAGLDFEKAGIELEKGAIKVNENYETNIPGIFAIGDVNAKIMLAHVASHQGIQVSRYIIEKKPIQQSPIPSCVFIFPEIATVGMTEEKAKESGIGYKTSRFLVGANGKAMTLEEPEGLVKVICDEQNHIIGVHIMGAHASDLIGQGVLAIDQKMKAKDFSNLIFAHPTLAESLEEAILGIDDQAIHLIPKRKKA